MNREVCISHLLVICFTHISSPIPTYPHLSSPIPTYPHLSPPILIPNPTYPHLSSPIPTYPHLSHLSSPIPPILIPTLTYLRFSCSGSGNITCMYIIKWNSSACFRSNIICSYVCCFGIRSALFADLRCKKLNMLDGNKFGLQYSILEFLMGLF